MPEFKFNFDFIPLPFSFIDKFLTETNGAYIRVYLYALSLAVKGESSNNAQIAKRLNLLESDVMNAISYWQEKGMLDASLEDTVLFNSEARSNAFAGIDSGEENFEDIEETPFTARKKERKPAEAIQYLMENDKALADLCMVSQEILGRVLTKTEIETIYWFYDELGFTPDVIACLLEYCVSINKTNIGYIEKVAIGWDENGINTLEKAMDFMENESERKNNYYEMKRIFGINDRSLTGMEENHIKTWTEKYGMSKDMIALAYEYCIMRINKLSFPYMDSILKNWHKKGIKSVEAAKKDQEDFKAKNKKFEQKDTSIFEKGSYDPNTIEKLMREKYN